MSKWHRTIFTGMSANNTWRDTKTALFFLLPTQWRSWFSGSCISSVERSLEKLHDGSQAVTFDSGRTALWATLKALGVGTGDHVYVQAYTCVVVVNAIRALGAQPIYIDIDADTLNMDPDNLQHAISTQGKALIVQHTFGLPADMSRIQAIAQKHKMPVVEDCAHALGARFADGARVGTKGDAAIVSFGSNKVVSSVRGGAALSADSDLVARLRAINETLPRMPKLLVLQHLLHLPIFWLGRMSYHMGIGKIILKIARMTHVVNFIVSPQEKRGGSLSFFPAQYPHVLACLVTTQLAELDAINEHRRTIAERYVEKLSTAQHVQPTQEGRVHLDHPICVTAPDVLARRAKQHGIQLGLDWSGDVLFPCSKPLDTFDYQRGLCPVAERVSAHIITLPTGRNVSLSDADRVIDIVREHIQDKT